MNESTHTHQPPTTDSALPAESLTRRTVGWRTALALGVLVVGVFLLGYVPASLRAANLARARDAAVAELRLAGVQSSLASAAIDARRGEYEAARQAAARFFSGLSDAVNGAVNTPWSLEQREALRPLLDQRDEVITLLARGDPASAERLTELYQAFRQSAAP